MNLGIELMERGLLPEYVVRRGIKQLVEKRLNQERRVFEDVFEGSIKPFLEALIRDSLAPNPKEANEQHYEVPAEFFKLVLGSHLKYSSCYFPNGRESLDYGEAASLDQVEARAEISDGQDVLELGCGWGSFSLRAAGRYPNSRFVAVSNSHSQRLFIEQQARERGIKNLNVITSDINVFSIDKTFDRVVSIEMFEHLRNYDLLFEKIASWLKPNGKLFVHVFRHTKYPYIFETDGADNWMGRYFFTGGIMPSDDLLTRFQNHLRLDDQWRLNGRHYERTALLWAENMDNKRDAVMETLEATYGKEDAKRWFYRWKAFFLSCAELFGYEEGTEWGVSHYLFSKNG